MEEFIEIGEIVRAHGINGEVKVKKLTSDSARFKRLKLVYIDEKPYKIMQLRDADDFVYLRFIGVSDRNTAASLKGKFISVNRVNAIDLEEGEYFIVDLVGASIVTESGNKLGIIKDIFSFGAADVIEATGERGNFSFPFLKKIVSEIDIESKLFVVKAEELEKVVVYED